ncbi:tyrosine-type recombinase/integrase [Halorubrum sp. CBA1229]|uniref:tyrosine-type recombinase/integrase n=1 Tax=Halorubrum sp. CBA1229 TaxID=1853699 RepID=UPI000F3F7252|nr:tyrosine-type recombinase/integrase [Halorubrum sp. CBA1229]QKY18024.1 tyrosine-type recombinase/integrase [Halorubrum sp. CBA1229]
MNDNLEPIEAAEAKEMYLEQRKQEVSESTIQAHHYRLKHFVRWCEEQEDLHNLNNLTGRDLQRYSMWRREDGDLNNVTMVTQLSTLRVFIKWCERIDAVEDGLHDKIILPDLSRHEDQRDAMLDSEDAKQLLEYMRQFEWGSRTHALIELLWYGGMRIGAAHGLDLDDYDPDEQYVEIRHRPDTETRLKNKKDGERFVGLSAQVCDAIDAYIKYKRMESEDDFGREPLFTSNHGRVSKSSLRDNIYRATRPCVYTGDCPHDREIDSCEAMGRDKASLCPSSVSPHAIRRGSITYHLTEDVPEKMVGDRMNVSLDVLEKHYDRRTEEEKASQRRDYLDNI